MIGRWEKRVGREKKVFWGGGREKELVRKKEGERGKEWMGLVKGVRFGEGGGGKGWG